LHFWEEEEQGSEDEFFRLRENERSELCSDENSPQTKLDKTKEIEESSLYPEIQ